MAKISGEVAPRPPKQFQRYSDSSHETYANWFFTDSFKLNESLKTKYKQITGMFENT